MVQKQGGGVEGVANASFVPELTINFMHTVPPSMLEDKARYHHRNTSHINIVLQTSLVPTLGLHTRTWCNLDYGHACIEQMAP